MSDNLSRNHLIPQENSRGGSRGSLSRNSAGWPSGGQSGGRAPREMNAAFVLHAWRHWWKIALPLGLLLGATAAGVCYITFQPMYQASAWLRMDEVRAPLVFHEDGGSRRFIETQVELIRSPLVLGPVVSQPEIGRLPELMEEDSPIDWLGKKIQVTSVGRSELFQVSFTGPDPVNASRIVTAVVNAYFSRRHDEEDGQTQKVIALLEQEKERRAREVERLRENVRELTKQATGKDPFIKQTAEAPTAHPLADLQMRLTTAEVERQVLEARVRVMEEAHAKQQLDVPQGVVARSVEQQPEIVSRKDAVEVRRAKLHEYETKLAQGGHDPLYVKLADEIKRDEESLEKIRREASQRISAELLLAMNGKRKDELATLRSQLEDYRAMEKLLKDRCDSQLKTVGQVSGETLDLEFKRAELERAEKVFNLIAERAVKLRTEMRAPERVTLLQQATPPTAPLEMYPYKRMAIGGAVGFLLPLLLVVIWERVVQRVNDPSQVEMQSNLPVLGEIARLPVRGVLPRKSSRRFGQDLRLFEESVESLRTCLVLSDPLRDMKVLAVTSGVRAEGKTSVALQLAVSIARASGQPTLLIDGDMRSPDVHEVLQLPGSPGLAEILAHECTLKDAVVTTWSDHVHVLPAGKLSMSPHKLLGNGALKSLMDEARATYRYIVIDTPPVLAASEALVFAKAADACLICAMRDRSRMDQVRKVHERLVTSGSRPVGIVLNGVPTKEYSYTYGTYAYES